MNSKKVIIIGGGAAGFFAAINCAEKNNNYEVIILEKSSKLLSKVRVSGGGRCNVTNACYDNNLLVKNYPRGEKELKNVFSKFSTKETVDWFSKRGVNLKTEPDGRIFPVSNNSETIINCLLQEAKKHKIEVKLNTSIIEIAKNSDGTFSLITNEKQSIKCDAVIIACGGNPHESAYVWLQKLGHTIKPPVPSLFTFNVPNNTITQLMGVSVTDAKVKIAGTKLESNGPLLITHWGFSGPSVLKLSAWGARTLSDFKYNFTFAVNWLPKFNEEKLKLEFNHQRLENASKFVVNTFDFELPKRLWEHLTKKAGIPDTTRWADLTKKQMNVLSALLIGDEYLVKGKTTFKEEFITCGGVVLKEIDLTKMQSKIIPNLFFAGEVIDVDGITGGFNFQNAWSTAYIASQNI